MNFVSKFLAFCLVFQISNAAYLIPPQVLTQIGASYTLILRDDFNLPVDCYVTDKKNFTYEVDLNAAGIPIRSQVGTKDIVTSLGEGICGIRVENVSGNLNSVWNITFSDKNGKEYFGMAYVIPRATITTETKTIYAPVGENVYINCGDEVNSKSLNYCQLFNPKGELVLMNNNHLSVSCSYSFMNKNNDVSTVSDFGKWKCLLSYESGMVENVIYFDLVKIETDVIVPWKNESDFHVNLGCSIINSTSSTDYCIMVKPDGQQMILKPGLATSRYSAVYTNDSKNICGMEIIKPLQDNEKGLWRCEHYGFNKIPIGGFIDLSDGKAVLPPQIPQEITTHVNKSFTIRCRVHYSSSYCYMRGPDGLFYSIENSRMPTVGLCEFEKKDVQISDNGTWICGFGKNTGEEDDIFSFQVKVFETKTVQPVEDSILSRTSGTARLMCSTRGIGDYPVQYCRFMNPKGKIFTIENKGVNERISYDGRGFEYGDCGIIIHDVRMEDEGTWSCITRVGANFKNPEVYTNIHLSVSNELSMASAVGIAIGVSVVVFGLLFLVIRSRRNSRISTRFTNPFRRNDSTRSSNSSGNSSTNSGVVFNVDNNQNRNYNSTCVRNSMELIDVDVIQDGNVRI